MDERSAEDQVSATLRAAADPTRRSILTVLAQEGPLRVTELAARYPVSLNTVTLTAPRMSSPQCPPVDVMGSK